MDLSPIEERFEDGVAEAKCEDVLDGFLAQIVIDAINLLFAQNPLDRGVQRSCAFKIMSERLFEYHANP